METHPKNKNFLRVITSGFAMGAADVVPGVSGGSIAFILGIYEDLLNAVQAVDAHFFGLLFRGQFRQAFHSTSWRFLIALGIGILLAVLTISRILVWGLEQQPELVWSFFFGLVLASVIVIWKRVQRWTVGAYLLTIAGAVLTYLLIGMAPLETPTAPWFLFLSGAVAISAMILPGISGAYILLVLGKYQFLLESLVNGDWIPLVIVAAGAGVGLISFARLLRWLFRRYHDLTIAVLIGLVIGALRKVWPWKESTIAGHWAGGGETMLTQNNILPPDLTLGVGLALGIMLTGFLTIMVLERFGSRQETLVDEQT